MTGRLPDFIIIGAMKSGTSSLHEQLALRSGIFMSTPKEPNFFGDDAHYEQGVESYSALFAAARDDQICGESSTHYTKLPDYPRTLERMRAHVGNAKLIYIMRHPIERMVSHYIHDWTERQVTESLESALRQYERYTALSSYARQLEPYLEAFGTGAVLPLFFERMITAQDETLAQVCQFIADPTPQPPVWDGDLPAQNVSRDRLRKNELRDGLLRITAVHWLKEHIPQPLRDQVKGVWQMKKRPHISDGLRAELEGQIDADLSRLGAWLGMELTCSGWRGQVTARPCEWKVLRAAPSRQTRPANRQQATEPGPAASNRNSKLEKRPPQARV